MNLEQYRRSDNTLDLEDAAYHFLDLDPLADLNSSVILFIRSIDKVHPVHSRQTAAVVLAMAKVLQSRGY